MPKTTIGRMVIAGAREKQGIKVFLARSGISYGVNADGRIELDS